MKAYLGELAMMFGVSLGLTIAVELVMISVFLRLVSSAADSEKVPEQEKRSRRSLFILVVLVNLLTNPLAVLLCWLGSLYLPGPAHFPLELGVEALVIIGEGCIYRSFGRLPQWRIPKPVLMSAAANMCSWLLGRLF